MLRRLFDDNQILLAYQNQGNNSNLRKVTPQEFDEKYQILELKEEELLRKQFLGENHILTVKYSLIEIDRVKECVIQQILPSIPGYASSY